jgi:hypothetical protein
MAENQFSYESDIAPLRGSNFGSVATMPTMAALERAKDIETESRIASIREQSNMADLEFQRAQLAIEAAKRDARQQTEAARLYPLISERLTGLLGDETKDSVSKITEIEKIRGEFGSDAIGNPALNSIFNSAYTALSAKDAAKKDIEARAGQFAFAGQPEAVKSLFGGNVESGVAQQYYNAAKEVSRSEAEKSKRIAESEIGKEQMKAASERQKELLSNQTAYYRDQLKVLEGFAPPKKTGEEDVTIGTLKSGAAAPTIEAPKSFAKEDRIELEQMFKTLNPSYEDVDLSSIKDDELYRDTYKGTQSALRRSIGLGEQRPSISSKFK